MTADIYENNNGNVLASYVSGVSDVTGTKCIFMAIDDPFRKMVAVELSSCLTSDAGHLDLSSLKNEWKSLSNWILGDKYCIDELTGCDGIFSSKTAEELFFN